MAKIKLEIELDSNDLNDQKAFTNLMHAFSGSPTVQVISSKNDFPLQELKEAVKVQSPSTSEPDIKTSETNTEPAKDTTEVTEYSETEMLKMPNSDLKEYATALGIDWAKAEGKNTNRKLTDLVLAFREEGSADEASDENDTDPGDLAGETSGSLVGVDYNDLKVALGKKVDDHRPAIVAKLKEFGATRMPDLAEKHWEEMYEFLEAL